ncbi:MAG TPA: glycosyltransferase family 2 protein [Pyrinomonadaceae bacterium]|jgi:dolichol-phosphate mannosyltransferase|nr:glycosyltransferase family 2 protein [Pyrinomonadaceae bacterium]
MLISVIVPCYDEELVIDETNRELFVVLAGIADTEFEIIYVDDGSRDKTLDILRKIQSGDRRVRVLGLSRNFGHQLAVSAGLEYAAGDAVVIIDADLQDPPEVIPEMIARWRDGYQVVYGLRAQRAGETNFKLWTAKAFYRLINCISEIEIPLDVGDFRVLDRKVVDVLLGMPERDRFLRGMVSWIGFRQVGVLYDRKPRRAGESKYPLMRMLRFAVDSVISFSFAPLRLAIWGGFIALAASFAGIVYALAIRLYTTDWVKGWASIFTAVLFLGGVQLITLGIVGEYVGRIYAEVKLRPLFVVRERLGFDEEPEISKEAMPPSARR